MTDAFIVRRGGSGSGGLNFDVKGYKSEDSLPDITLENEIAVITEVEITSWAFSATEPENPSDGMVWIKTDIASDVAFNALKKGTLILYPTLCRQYISGEWISMNAHIYQGSDWPRFSLSWDGYYFKDGDQYTNVTGGWSSDVWGTHENSTVVVGNTLSVLTPDGAYAARVGTANPVDLTDVNTIWVDSPNGPNGNQYGGYLYICTAKNENTKIREISIWKAGVLSVDVSNLSGPHYLLLRAIGGTVGNKKGYTDVRAIWKE